jgi:6-phosphogluconolactonase/glucosamine-6-phosphate isomerase/deaminase
MNTGGWRKSNDQSYRYFMNDHLFDHINIDRSRTHVPSGTEPDAEKACADYDRTIQKPAAGSIFSCSASATTGTSAFNEPGVAFEKGTHIVSLSETHPDRPTRGSSETILTKFRPTPSPWASKMSCRQKKSS